jgi:hypothetical protein
MVGKYSTQRKDIAAGIYPKSSGNRIREVCEEYHAKR